MEKPYIVPFEFRTAFLQPPWPKHWNNYYTNFAQPAFVIWFDRGSISNSWLAVARMGEKILRNPVPVLRARETYYVGRIMKYFTDGRITEKELYTTITQDTARASLNFSMRWEEPKITEHMPVPEERKDAYVYVMDTLMSTLNDRIGHVGIVLSL